MYEGEGKCSLGGGLGFADNPSISGEVNSHKHCSERMPA
jgi:hypothetical protein